MQDIGAIEDLQFLININASFNFILDISFLSSELAIPHCLDLNLSNNKIENLCDLCPQRLRNLNLSNNPLKFFEGFHGHPELRTLSLRSTALKTIFDPNTKLPNLTHLYLPAIESFETKELVFPALPSLEVLHMRGTPVESVKFENSPNLKYLNLRETKVLKITFLDEIIKNCTKLETVILSGTPMEEEGEVGDLKKELMMKTIDLSPLTPANQENPSPIDPKKLLYTLKKINKEWVGGMEEGGEEGEENDP